MKKGKLHQTEHFLLKPGAKIPVFGGGWCVWIDVQRGDIADRLVAPIFTSIPC